MATLAQVKKAAAKIGATIEQGRSGEAITCEAFSPPGFMFSEGSHVLVDSSYLPFKPDYANLLERIGYGLEPCTVPDCECCEEAREERRP